ncbi:MAG: flagellar assembly protein FliW, partial [Ilumatobacteraceae bacterium]
DLPDEELSRIGVEEAADVQLFVVASIADYTSELAPTGDPGTIFLNLAAPITVNMRTHEARQVILDRQGWPLRHAVATRG